MKAKQSGSALLLSLMVLALVSGIATNILVSVQNEQAVVQRIQTNSAVKQQLLGGEAWAESWFAKENGTNRTPLNSKAVNAPGLILEQKFKTDTGELKIYIFDLQTCINVNSLMDTKHSEVTRQRLKVLSKELGVSDGWISVLSDWMDADQQLGSAQGQEDPFYLSKEKPYRTAGQPLFSSAELPLLNIPKSSLQTLAPYLCVLPQSVGLNINRTPNLLIKSYIPDISAPQLLKLGRLIREEGFGSVSLFVESESLGGAAVEKQDWSTDTGFISVYTKLTVGDEEYWLHSQLNKNTKGKILPFYRAFSPLDKLSAIKLQSLEGVE